jgi:glycosyltransferase involved in cell wall biosynthesis
MKKRIVVDVANLTISDTHLKKTGIQEVIHQVLLGVVRNRKKFPDKEIILLPFLPEGSEGSTHKIFLRNPKQVLKSIEESIGLTSNEIWGFDFSKYNYDMSDEAIHQMLDSSDHIHIQSLFGCEKILKRKSSVTKSITLYDITPTLLPEYAGTGVADWFNKDYLPFVSCFNHIISISRHGLLDISDYGFSNSKQTLSYLQLPTYKIPEGIQTNSSARRPVNLDKYFVVVGSVEPRKNIVKLLEGFKVFSQLHTEYKLVFVGGSGWKSDIIFNKHCNDPQIKDRLHFTGYLSDEDMYAAIRDSQGLCMISCYEGYGLPLALARSLGKVSLSNWGSSLPEASSYSSVYVESWDEYSIASGMQEMIERKSFSSDQEDFDWDAYVCKLIEMI